MSKLERIHTKLRPDMVRLPEFVSILIVDDQRFDRTRLQRLISTLDFDTHVVEADSLETMGTKLQLDKFDLILLDYNLSDGTGLQALEAIRLDPKNRQAATIMIAGDGQSEIAIEALKRGCSDYITKDDLNPASLRRAAVNALQKAHLSVDVETKEAGRKEMERLLQRFSHECATEIKPVVSRMMRQLRDFRDAQARGPEAAAEQYERIEKSCMRLWDFLEDLEQYQGTDLVTKALGPTIPGLGDAPKTVPRRVRPVVGKE